ncbi:MAG: cation transporter [Clostridia bacterium]|nr:cation transporter [Clostridia bacterium]
MASTVGIICNLLLFGGKLAAGLLTGAVSITADAINNLSDAGSQIISFISFKLSSKPADRDHPFGHARIEYVASMAVSFLILLVGFELLKSSVTKIFNPEETKFRLISAIILAASIVVKLWLCLFNRQIAKKIDSQVMRATAADSLSDACATAAVLVSSLVLRFFGIDVDAYVGIAVAILILIAGIKVLGEAKNLIIGEAPDADVVKSIRDIVGQYPEALGIHDMVVHNYGAGAIIASLHIEVDGSVDVFKTHDTVDNIEKHLSEALGIRTTIHMDPIVTGDEEVAATRAWVAETVHSIDPAWNIHDFRFVRGETHTNLIFDLVIPFECTLSPREAAEKVEQTIRTNDPHYFTVITVDRE